MLCFVLTRRVLYSTITEPSIAKTDTKNMLTKVSTTLAALECIFSTMMFKAKDFLI